MGNGFGLVASDTGSGGRWNTTTAKNTGSLDPKKGKSPWYVLLALLKSFADRYTERLGGSGAVIALPTNATSFLALR